VHVSVTRTKTGDISLDTAAVIGEEMTGWLQDIEGFEGLVLLSREGQTLGVAFWESAEIAEKYAIPRQKFRERMLAIADVEIEEVVDYTVTFAYMGGGLRKFAS
jgi:hypothetical protein